MKVSPNILSLALLAALAAPAAHAEIAIDNIADSEVSFEGLLQTDAYWYDSDFINLDADPADGGDANFEWALGYDASGDGKFLDAFAKYKLGGNGNHFIQAGQFKQPNSLEELSSTKNNDFISKAMATNTFAVARRLGVGYAYGDSNWGITASMFGRELTRNRAGGEGPATARAVSGRRSTTRATSCTWACRTWITTPTPTPCATARARTPTCPTA